MVKIEEGDFVKYSKLHLVSLRMYLGIDQDTPLAVSKRRGLAGNSKTYPTKVMYREVLWEDMNRVEEVREEWLEKAE